MRVIRVLPLGLLVSAGLNVHCGDGSQVSETAAEVQQPAKKGASPFESIVEENDYVSNLAAPGSKNPQSDPDLLNAWGLVFSDQGLAWVAANHTGTDRVYDSEGNLRGVVKIPLLPSQNPATDIPAPTGQVANPFHSAFKGDDFIVVSEDGAVIGIKVKGARKGMLEADAVIEQDNSHPDKNHALPANYKGVALATVNGKPRLFAADFRNSAIDVFDEHFVPIANPGFQDNDALLRMKGRTFAPFNILAAGDRLIVSYAVQGEGADDDVAGPGNGIIDIFETNGRFVERLLTGPDGHPELNSPWGMALSREKSEKLSIDLLIGNFGDSQINVYELKARGRDVGADFEGPLGVANSKKPPITGLWAIVFGNGKGGFDRDDLYFTAGPNNGPGTDLEQNGLFGELDFITPRR
jgi:uncharacterized protein (TIGR03118 family)